MHIFRAFPSLLMVLCMASFAAAQETPKPRGEKITLELKLKKDDQKNLIYKIEVTSNVLFQGQPLEFAMKMGMYLGTKVEDVDAEGIHTLKMSYDRITMDMASAVYVLNYDSKEPEKAPDNPAVHTFNAIVGQAVTLKVQPDGTTKEMVGLDELSKKLQEKAPKGTNIKQQLETMKSAFEQLATYPGKPVDIGDTWNRKLKMPMDGGQMMDLDATYTLYDRKGGSAIIKMVGKITAANGMKGTNSGTLYMDEATGWITRGEMVMELAGEIAGGSVKVKGKSTISEK